MRNKIAKKIRKGCTRDNLTRQDYQAHKNVFKALITPFKKELAQKIKEAKAV